MTKPIPVEEAKLAFEQAIRRELADLEASARALVTRCQVIAEHGRGVNGLAPAARGWSKEIENVADKIRDEGPDVSKALIGTDATPIESAVDLEHAARVKNARPNAA